MIQGLLIEWIRLTLEFAVRPPQQLKEYVEVPLPRPPRRHPRLLQQIPVHIRARNRARPVKVDPHELAEPGRVVVLHRLRIPKGLQDRVGLEDLALELPQLLAGGGVELAVGRGLAGEEVDRGGRGERVGGDGGEVLDNFLGVLGLARAGLAGDEDGLGLVPRGEHVLPRLLRHRVDVRGVLLPPLVLVLCQAAGKVCQYSRTVKLWIGLVGLTLDGLRGIDWERPIGVHCDEEQARVRLRTHNRGNM